MQSNTQFVESIKKFLTENPESTDVDMKNYIYDYLSAKSKSDKHKESSHKSNLLFNPYAPFSPFLLSRNVIERFNEVSKMMDTDFDDFNLTQFEDNKKDPSDRAYVQSKSSFVTYHNGEKRKKTLEVSQKYDKDGNLKVHKRKTNEDQTGKTVEEYFPDGTKKVFTTKSDPSLLDKHDD